MHIPPAHRAPAPVQNVPFPVPQHTWPNDPHGVPFAVVQEPFPQVPVAPPVHISPGPRQVRAAPPAAVGAQQPPALHALPGQQGSPATPQFAGPEPPVPVGLIPPPAPVVPTLPPRPVELLPPVPVEIGVLPPPQLAAAIMKKAATNVPNVN